MMSGFFQRTWRWLACENNRGRVIVIATVAGVLIAAITFVAHLQTPASEVRMSVPDFQDALERRAKEVRNDLACASHLSHPGCIKNADRSAGTGDGTIFAVRRA